MRRSDDLEDMLRERRSVLPCKDTRVAAIRKSRACRTSLGGAGSQRVTRQPESGFCDHCHILDCHYHALDRAFGSALDLPKKFQVVLLDIPDTMASIVDNEERVVLILFIYELGQMMIELG